jgi:hypothetical protein
MTPVMHCRIQGVSRCIAGMKNEYVCHLLFFCPGSRATWFGLGINIRVEEMSILFKEALLYLAAKLKPPQMALVVNTMWCIWKARNASVIEGKRVRSKSIIQQARAMPVRLTTTAPSRQVPRYQVRRDNEVVIVDASWDQNQRGGLTYMRYSHTGARIWSVGEATSAPDAFSAETMAVHMAV